MLKWATLNWGELDGKQILPAFAYAEIWKPQVEVPWGGGQIGSSNAFYLVPEKNMTLHVTVNHNLRQSKGTNMPMGLRFRSSSCCWASTTHPTPRPISWACYSQAWRAHASPL